MERGVNRWSASLNVAERNMLLGSLVIVVVRKFFSISASLQNIETDVYILSISLSTTNSMRCLWVLVCFTAFPGWRLSVQYSGRDQVLLWFLLAWLHRKYSIYSCHCGACPVRPCRNLGFSHLHVFARRAPIFH